MKKDGKEDEQAVEKKYRWDEENRLLASDENGFVASYWYDADGERTVKSSGEGEQVYVNCRASREQSQACLSFAKAQPTIICDNSEFSGGVTNTAKFSLYVSPYLVASQGGKYTKHIYIGSQRIVSKLGDLASYGADPRRIPYAGTEADGVSVDYQTKYNRQQQAIKDNYADFGVPYNGEDNNDYANGEGFCCNDGTPTVARAKAARSIDGNFKPNDDYEKMQFYYHPDHLGSSSYITNLDGEVVQHIEYVPFGEVFIEERNNTWNTPYLFNAKEYDEETGMYYYGARYYEPRISLWMSVDPLAEEYSSLSSYSYCANNPINSVDVKGKKILLVNGFWMKGILGEMIGSNAPKQQYWGRGFANAAQKFFKDNSTITESNYIDGSSKWGGDMSGSDRFDAGYEWASKNIKSLTNDLKEGEAFNIVTHSEGAAYGSGIAKYLIENHYKVNMILHLSADEGDEFTTPKEPFTIQLSYFGDWVTGNKIIQNTDLSGEVNSKLSWKFVHGTTKNASVFNQIEDLISVRTQDNIGMLRGKFASWRSQVPGSTQYGTDFKKINGITISNNDGSEK